jgi:hypothetical protein
MLKLLEFRPLRKGVLRGFASIRLRNGLRIFDVVVCQAGDGSAWAIMPSKPMIDDDGVAMRDERGKIRYRPVMEWPKEQQTEFSRRVISLVRSAHPQALDEIAGSPRQARFPGSSAWNTWPLGRPATRH